MPRHFNVKNTCKNIDGISYSFALCPVIMGTSKDFLKGTARPMEFTSYLFGCISTFSREIASEVGNSNTYRAIQALVQDWSIIK